MPNTFEQTSSSTQSGSGNKPKYSRTSSTSSATSQSYTRLLSPTAGKYDGEVKFPRIDECAHFHYETVECGKVATVLLDGPPDVNRVNGGLDFEKQEPAFWVKVSCKGNEWVIRRVAKQFKTLDGLLHECVYDRRFTQLPALRKIDKNEDTEAVHQKLRKYMARLSDLPEDQMSCAPVLHWFEMDNKGRNLVAVLRETADINIPAVAAAHAVRRYTAQTADELTLEVGDMVSIIDMTDSNWWRGKCRLRVGSFPSQCVRRINDARQADEAVPVNLPSSPTSASPPAGLGIYRAKPIVKKHGKFMEFLRSFLVTRPTKSRLKQSGILKERVFGCDLGEYLHNSGDEVPVVVTDCTAFVEKYGIVDGIYRISGVSSHVQNLRHEYDCERRPNLNRDPSGRGEQSICDPHSVAGLCKLYFRELPNPLLTYQLYNRFAEAINAPEDDRLLKIHDVIQQLPPPHYRTLKHLALHLQRMAGHDGKTSMHCRNLAIVWAPNLLRSRDLEAGLAAFTEARVQSVVTEFLVSNADVLFSEKLQNMQYDASRGQKPPRPKSLMVLSAPKLISLEEAQARSRAGTNMAKPAGERFNSDIIEGDDANRSSVSDVYRRKSSSPPTSNKKTTNTTTSPTRPPPVAVVPLSGSHSVINKRRQSMDPKLTRPQNNFPSRQYSHNSGSGWRSKIGSFLKKGGAPAVENKPRVKVALRRSQSDDSLLSPHNSRQDINKVGKSSQTVEDKILAKEPRTNMRPAMRQVHSPRRSPRPKGRVFMVYDPTDDPANSPPAKQRNIVPKEKKRTEEDKNGSFTPTSPISLPTLSLETLTNSVSAFSGLESLPDIMGDGGLDFDPLQFDPTTFSPTDRKNNSENVSEPPSQKEDTKSESDIENVAPSSSTTATDEQKGADSDGAATEKRGKREIKRYSSKRYVNITNLPPKEQITPKKVNGVQDPTGSTDMAPKYEDILNANVRLLVKDDAIIIQDVCEKISVPKVTTVKTEVVNGGTDTNSHRQENNNNNRRRQAKENSDPNLDRTDASSLVSQNKGADSSPEVQHRRRARNREQRNGKTETSKPASNDTKNTHHETKDKSRQPGSSKTSNAASKSLMRPVDLAVKGDYSVHYICNSHRSNGRMRQSITAAFVQDRARDMARQPHSIVRSLDVPPTMNASKPPHKHHSYAQYPQSSNSPITKRQRALMAVASLRHRDSIAESKRLHYRSLSAGDELDYGRKLKNKQAALPRNPSNASSHRTPPQPRRRRSEREKALAGMKNKGSESDLAGGHHTYSAPSTPVGGSPNPAYTRGRKAAAAVPLVAEECSNLLRNARGKRLSRSRDAIHTQDKQSDESDGATVHAKHKQLTKTQSASGIVSPSDNICASTGLSWV